MKIKFWQVIILVLIVAGGWMIWKKSNNLNAASESVKIIYPHRGDIKIVISTTGTVLPKNRLQVKPPVNGRIEEVLVKEGQQVKVGDILVWMSSADRAALLDAARGRGEAALKEWQEVYKPISLMSPINGEVIVGTIQPGQTVTTTDDVVVLSDRLIVRAQVDETDIGKIQNGQSAVVNLDAYPDVKINGVVDHIYYESKTVNNVTIYDVDLSIEDIPPFFRSGMNANIDFVTESKKDILLLPLTVIQRSKDGSSVMLSAPRGEKPVRRAIETGISDDKNIEVVSGVSENDEIIMTTKKYSLPQSNGGGSPFMPSRRR
jgi:macrolide-specific efflux system membrane fusion protein